MDSLLDASSLADRYHTPWQLLPRRMVAGRRPLWKSWPVGTSSILVLYVSDHNPHLFSKLSINLVNYYRLIIAISVWN